MIESGKRLEHYQALFREVNDCIRDGADLDVAIFMCECGHIDCLSTVALSLEEYKRIRSNPTWFVLKPGHAVPEIARVISEDSGFVVVERLTVFDDKQEAARSLVGREAEDAALGRRDSTSARPPGKAPSSPAPAHTEARARPDGFFL